MAAMIRTASSPRTTITRLPPASMRGRGARGGRRPRRALVRDEGARDDQDREQPEDHHHQDAAVLYEGADREWRLREDRGGDDQGDPGPEGPPGSGLAPPPPGH